MRNLIVIAVLCAAWFVPLAAQATEEEADRLEACASYEDTCERDCLNQDGVSSEADVAACYAACEERGQSCRAPAQ